MSAERIEAKIDKLIDEVHDMNARLGVYNEQLKMHIKRTEILEETLKPVVKHVDTVRAVSIFLGGLLGVVGAALTLISRFT